MIPAPVWIVLGVLAFGAYIVGHRKGIGQAQLTVESQEASVPLQPYTQPQPPQSSSLAYGAVPFGTDAGSNTISGQVVYTSPVGAFVG